MADLEVYAENGVKQFDSNQRPMTLRQVIYLDASQEASPRTMGGNTSNRTAVWYRQSISVGAPDAVLAFAGPVFAKVERRSGSTWVIAYLLASATLEVFVFSPGASGGGGFEMYTEDGALTLSANDLPMRVNGGAAYAFAGQPYNPPSVGVGGKGAVVHSAAAQVRSAESAADNGTGRDLVRISQSFLLCSGGQVSVTRRPYVTLDLGQVDPEGPTALNTGTFVTVDVSGF